MSRGRARAAIAGGPSASKSSASGRRAAEQRDERVARVRSHSRLEQDGGRHEPIRGREVGRLRAEVHPDAEQHASAGAELGQHAAQLALAADDVVRPAQARGDAERPGALDGRDAAREAERSDLVRRAQRPEQDRDQQGGTRGRFPAPSAATPAGLLHVRAHGRERGRALLGEDAQLILRRRAGRELVRADSRIGHLATIGAVPALTTPFGRETIEQLIPHREPFLLIDEIVELEPGVRVVARSRVRGDEWYLRGHFPGDPIMPGVLMVEALAQAGAVGVLSHPDFTGRVPLFAGIDGVRFRRVVRPGDVLDFELVVDRLRRTFGRGTGIVHCNGERVLDAQLSFGFTDA